MKSKISKRFKASKRFNLSKIILPALVFFVLLAIFSMGFVKAEGKKYPLNITKKNHVSVCPGPVSKGFARCYARTIVDSNGKAAAAATPSGYGNLEFHTAYNLPNNAVSGNPIIAIVDAYDNPSAYSDLNYYSATYGIPQLPLCSGSISSNSGPCFQKIDQNGGSSYPRSDSGWGLEIALDIQVAHAICQNCKILLVEAKSNFYSDLMTAINQAVLQGAVAISNSWAGSESSGETAYDSYLNHPGIAITAASGDSGYGAGTVYPAASPYVISVGGTTLQINSDNSYYNETVWTGTGSGCSLYESKPLWQKDSGCSKRTLNDVSADADPNTGAAIYDSSYSPPGWFQVGGTSLSTPIIAAVYALAGVQPGIQEGSLPYANFDSLHDITSGVNGGCSIPYLCGAGFGFDGPTGMGTPNGLGGFIAQSTSPTPSLTPGPTATPTPTFTPTPTVTPIPVSVIITSPVNNSNVSRNSNIKITTNTSSSVSKVDFTVNGSLICTDNIAPFTCNWRVPNTRYISYTITALAQDSFGNTASSTVKVTSR